mmetsp:Transcript_24998/g.37309  ORF Transcript_24998/g.37309 Transcript_24998/m.37309 type:complete len:246 (-) Transcript_24998:112-849(-)
MKIGILSLITFASALTSVAGAAAAKFAVDWAEDDFTLYNIDGKANTAELLATIKPPGNGKELLVGLSGVVNIMTLTSVKATNKAKAGQVTAVADAAVSVALKIGEEGETAAAICNNDDVTKIAAPGNVTLSSRKQTLSVEVDLDVVCKDSEDTDCVAIADALGIDGYVAVELALDTTAAHHFNFVIMDVPVGTFNIVACFAGAGGTSLTADAEGTSAMAFAAIGKRMLTVEQVKAAKTRNEVIEP